MQMKNIDFHLHLPLDIFLLFVIIDDASFSSHLMLGPFCW